MSRLKARQRGMMGMAVLFVLILGSGACETRRRTDDALVEGLESPIADGEGSGIGYRDLPEPLRETLLETHSLDEAARLGALRQLVQLTDPRSLDRLIELVSDGDVEVACLAAEAVGALGAEGRPACGALVAGLEAPSARMRQCALLALARVGGDQALDRLLAYLESAGPGEVEDAVDALGRLGRIEADAEIVPYLEARSPSLVRVTVAAIERIGPGGADLVRPFLESEEPGARCAAAGILARWESVDDETALRRLARYDAVASVRVCALGALGRLGDTEAVAELAERVVEGSRAERVGAAQALGLAATSEAVRALIRSLTSFHAPPDTNPAQAALLSIGRSARPALEEALPTGPPLRRAIVAETLGLLGDSAAIPSLEQAVMDTDPTVRDAAEAALAVLR